jgi:allophanate hydrolase subunit 2
MLRIGTDVGSKPLMNRLPEQLIESLYKRQPLRITWGPQRDFFADDALRLFLTSPFRVLENSNRMGLRLSGPAIPRKSVELLTEGVPLGAIQIPQDGQPIILFVEHQTTGGYPKIANVIAADIHRVGQLRPRDEVRFELVPFKKAKQILLDQESLLQQQLENRQ